MTKQSLIGAVLSVTFLIALPFAGRVKAQTIRRVPADYSTIQQAIDASFNGDTVLVAPGTYVENIDFLGKAITVTSEKGPQLTIIDGNQVNSVVTFRSGEGPASIITGFTIQNGNATGDGFNGNIHGGGIYVQNGSPTILRNVIKNNQAENGGGGIGVYFGSPAIQENTITNNSQNLSFSGGIGGGGISVLGPGSTQIIGNTISVNSWLVGGGITLVSTGSVVVRNNTISDNIADAGGGMSIVGSPAVVVHNLIKENRAQLGGGIRWIIAPDSVVNNTIVGNDSARSSGIHAIPTVSTQSNIFNNIIVANPSQTAVFCEGAGPESAPTFQFTNAFSPQGISFGGSCTGQVGLNGNISADPLFVNPSGGDYHLRSGSPSIDAGDNAAPNVPVTDLDGNPRIQDGNGDGVAVVDMGAYEASPPSPPFDICIQDDNSGSILRFNSSTGDYQFTNCSGFTVGGIGGLIRRGGVITLQHYASDRRVLARIDTSVNKATVSLQLFSPSTTFTITDRNTSNNTCACAPHLRARCFLVTLR